MRVGSWLLIGGGVLLVLGGIGLVAAYLSGGDQGPWVVALGAVDAALGGLFLAWGNAIRRRRAGT